ncbi:type IV secretory system conjugative DNA transfer family protein [Pseudophaeobacter sp.]|uniref:type IV secretory system conjugative DNA transfer family protein n=1 Tax=Pseudophaeobacter sp. TaxID=1971739 RepID=UPI0032968B4A
MTFGLGSKLHAFVHSIGQTSDEAEVRKLYADVERLFSDHHLLFADGRSKLVRVTAERVLETHNLPADHPQFGYVATLLSDIMEYEELFQLPTIDNRTRSTAEWWALRDALARQAKLFDNFDATCDALRILMAQLYGELWQVCPTLLSSAASEGVTVPSELSHILGNTGQLVRSGSEAVFSKRLTNQSLLPNQQGRLEYNLITASGGNPADVKAFTRTPKHADKSDISDPKALVDTYWGGTPLASLFDQKVQFTIPTSARFEHHHIVAGSGHGKTQTLQYLIASDIEKVISGNQSVVVIDSQGDLIRNISNMAVFAPDGPLHDRIVIIDPTDVEYPVSLNLFDVGQDRLESYGLLERERLTNSILELYDFVLGTLLDAGMTQKQSVIFRYVTRLMLHIPDATIHTLRELMEPNAEVKFASDIAKLSGTAKHFFETEFSSREFEQTKKQVLRRLWGILENQTFERMFSHPKSKLDLFCEMNAGKVILINTAKDLLKESGTEIFGRFFIALIAQAAQERATLPKSERTPTMVYIDEAADYFDRNIGVILSTARKYNVGMVLAHQYLAQLDPKLQEAFSANTSIKFAGGVSAKDARSLASQLYCDPSLIEQQAKGSFAAYVRGETPKAVPLSFPFGFMERQPKMRGVDRDALQEQMRKRYATHYMNLGADAGSDDAHEVNEEPEAPVDPNEPTPYW